MVQGAEIRVKVCCTSDEGGKNCLSACRIGTE
jgi:hypothetical protein